MSTSTAVVAEPVAWFTWRRAGRVAGFVLLSILSVNFFTWWLRAVDEHHPISSCPFHSGCFSSPFLKSPL